MYLREQKSLYCMCKWMQILENTTVAMHNTVTTRNTNGVQPIGIPSSSAYPLTVQQFKY